MDVELLIPKLWRIWMIQEAGVKEKHSGISHLKWAVILAIVFLIVIGITSAKSIHGILLKKSSSAVPSQVTSSQIHP